MCYAVPPYDLAGNPDTYDWHFMRWKLLIAASLLATLVGAGAALVITHFALGAAGRVVAPPWLMVLTLALPLASITVATIFVYRHTSRRRALQAAATALLSITLTLAALLAIPYFFAARPFPLLDPPPPQNAKR